MNGRMNAKNENARRLTHLRVTTDKTVVLLTER